MNIMKKTGPEMLWLCYPFLCIEEKKISFSKSNLSELCMCCTVKAFKSICYGEEQQRKINEDRKSRQTCVTVPVLPWCNDIRMLSKVTCG